MAAASPVSRAPDVGPDRHGWISCLAICSGLAAIVWVVFGQVLRHAFLNYDDNIYLSPMVARGLTWEGLRWAFTYGGIGHWHPLTWISHMLDSQIYGRWPGGHHLTSVLIHCANAILLFLVLRRMTSGFWRSAFVAALFAIHPLRVESVAWVAERKDVLGGFFFMLTLGAYACYVRRPESVVRYGLVGLSFALGLLSKDMLVTLPFVLLLLDYWPLHRLTTENFATVWRRLLIEKIPLLVLSAASCAVTILVPEHVVERVPFFLRCANAAVSVVIYLWQALVPVCLAAPYPYPHAATLWWQVGPAVALLLGITYGVSAGWRRAPWLVVGWFWYVGMLVPVLGIVQISTYAHADRYTYLPQIGIYLLGTWAVAEGTISWPRRRLILGGAAGGILLILMAVARQQTSYWRDSETWWRHTLACTADNAIAHNDLANLLIARGGASEALPHYEEAVRISPGYAEAQINLGSALAAVGRTKEAIGHYQRGISLSQDPAPAYYNLGNALCALGDYPAALEAYEHAISLRPALVQAYRGAGDALASQGDASRAGERYRAAIRIDAAYFPAHRQLATLLLVQGRPLEAIEQYLQADQLSGGKNPAILEGLAGAYLAAGRISDARATIQRALQEASANGDANLAEAIRKRLESLQ